MLNVTLGGWIRRVHSCLMFYQNPDHNDLILESDSILYINK
jgi:hypothetical protein